MPRIEYFDSNVCIFWHSRYLSSVCSSSYLPITCWCFPKAAGWAWNRWDHSVSYLLQCIICWVSADNERIRFPSSRVIGSSAACGTKSLSLTFSRFNQHVSAKGGATGTTNHNLTFTRKSGPGTLTEWWFWVSDADVPSSKARGWLRTTGCGLKIFAGWERFCLPSPLAAIVFSFIVGVLQIFMKSNPVFVII